MYILFYETPVNTAFAGALISLLLKKLLLSVCALVNLGVLVLVSFLSYVTQLYLSRCINVEVD
jgi:hypothetical protein